MKKLEKKHLFYASLLRLYPKPYRKRYSQEILRATDDMLSNTPSGRSKLSAQAHLAIDLSLNAGKQQLNYVGGVMQSEMPRYIKINALIASILLLPFLAVQVANGMDKLINNRNLYNTWLWNAPFLRIWVIILPAIAFLFVAASYIVFVVKSSPSKQSLLKRMFDIRRMWPIILPGLIAFGVLFIVEFHDSGQCWVQSPTHLATHLSQVWQCTFANRANHLIF